MSKIDQLQPGQPSQVTQTPQPGRPHIGESFQSVLNQAAQRAAAPASPPAQTGQAAPAGNAVSASQETKAAQPPSDLQAEGLSRAGRALDLLDAYALALANPQQPLKKVAALVKDLQGEAQGLGRVLERMDPQDGLYGLLQEVASTAEVETAKFNRGDYV